MFEWVLHIVETSGYLGIFFLMIVENVFPPVPSELVIPLAGFAAAAGKLNLFGVMLATTLGGVVGSIPWYVVCRLFGIERVKRFSEKYGRILTLDPDDLELAERWFHKYGHLTVLFGRIVPTLRSLVSLPAGFARMPFWSFVVYSAIGIALWNMLLLFFGYALQSQYEKISVYVDFVSNAVTIGFLAIYFYRIFTYPQKRRRHREAKERMQK
jgi:membrane protein DedA with SNARE-associated domain